MKRLLLLLIVSIPAVLLMAGCDGEVKTYIDAGKPIAVKAGQEFIIAVDSNPTTGYVWQEMHDVTMVSLEEDRYEPDEKAEGLAGAGGTQYYRYKALKQGDTEVILVYVRPWEPETAKENVFKVTIR
jgi:inhibitor of cysteine peptidase